MNKIRSVIACALIVSMAGVGLPFPVQAGMVDTERAMTGSSARTRITSILDRADVRAQLQAHGVNPRDIHARVAALTDDEVAELADRIEQLPAGGFVEVILLLFVILLITDILGFTKVFPFTRPIR